MPLVVPPLVAQGSGFSLVVAPDHVIEPASTVGGHFTDLSGTLAALQEPDHVIIAPLNAVLRRFIALFEVVCAQVTGQMQTSSHGC
jgi:hypothetical protein